MLVNRISKLLKHKSKGRTRSGRPIKTWNNFIHVTGKGKGKSKGEVVCLTKHHALKTYPLLN